MKNIMKYIKFVIALSLFFFGSLFQYIIVWIMHIDTSNMTVTTSNYLNIFSNLICFLILIFMYYKDIIAGIKDLKEKKYKPLETGINYWLIGLFVMIASNLFIGMLNSGSTSNNEESIRTIIQAAPFVSSISIVVIGPIIEELVFRKSFYDIFKNQWVYLITSGVLFGALHVILSPINSWIDYLYLIPYCSMGVSFAYMYYKTGNLMVPITFHMFHNLLNVISTLILAGVLLW